MSCLASLRSSILGAVLTQVSGSLKGKDFTELDNGQEISDGRGVERGDAGICGVNLWYWRNAVRPAHLLRDGIPSFESGAGGRVGRIILDQELGWRATEHYAEVLVEKTKEGIPYSVRRSQKQCGFHQFGDQSSIKLKILVIGDSFTHTTAVLDERIYHAMLSNLFDVEVVAYGVGG